MAVKIKVVKRKVLNGAEKDSVKNYAIAKTSGTSDLNKLCKLICSRSTLSSADVKAVLDSLNWAMDLELSSGNVVQLGEFGNFRMSRFIKLGDGSGTVLRQRGAIGRIW